MQKSTMTRLFFRYLGWYYDWMMGAQHERSMRAKFAAFVDPHPDDSLIEFGCGPGNTLEIVASRCRTACGTDASPQMLALAKRRLRGAGISNIELICSPAESFTAPKPFDIAVSVAFLYQFDTPEAIVRKMMSCVRPGGTIASMDPSATFTPSNVKSFIRSHQLGLKECYVLWDWARAARFYRRFSDDDLEGLYAAAGLECVELGYTLDGMVVFSKGKRPL